MDRSGDGTFLKSYRLRGRTDFIKVLRSEDAKKCAGRYCRMAAVESADGQTRFGIVISKAAGGAVRRNRIKRIIREYLRNNRDNWPSNRMIVISVSRPMPDEAALIAEIGSMLKDLK